MMMMTMIITMIIIAIKIAVTIIKIMMNVVVVPDVAIKSRRTVMSTSSMSAAVMRSATSITMMFSEGLSSCGRAEGVAVVDDDNDDDDDDDDDVTAGLRRKMGARGLADDDGVDADDNDDAITDAGADGL